MWIVFPRSSRSCVNSSAVFCETKVENTDFLEGEVSGK